MYFCQNIYRNFRKHDILDPVSMYKYKICRSSGKEKRHVERKKL